MYPFEYLYIDVHGKKEYIYSLIVPYLFMSTLPSRPWCHPGNCTTWCKIPRSGCKWSHSREDKGCKTVAKWIEDVGHATWNFVSYAGKWGNVLQIRKEIGKRVGEKGNENGRN